MARSRLRTQILSPSSHLILCCLLLLGSFLYAPKAHANACHFGDGGVEQSGDCANPMVGDWYYYSYGYPYPASITSELERHLFTERLRSNSPPCFSIKARTSSLFMHTNSVTQLFYQKLIVYVCWRAIFMLKEV